MSVLQSTSGSAGSSEEDIKLSHGPINLKKNDLGKVKMSNYFKIGIVLYCKGIYEGRRREKIV